MRQWYRGTQGIFLRQGETERARRGHGRWRALALWGLACLALAGPGVTPQQAQAQVSPAPDATDKAMDLEFWRGVAGSSDPALYEAYLQQFPGGTFAPLARAKLVALRRAAPAPAPATAPLTATPASAPAAPAPVVAPMAVPVAPPAPMPVPMPAPMPAPAMIPVAAPVPPAAAPQPLPAPIPAPALVPAAAPVPVVASGAAGGENADAKVLALLAAMQETPAAPAPPPPPPPLPAPIALPLSAAHDFAAERPQLAAVPAVALPPRFCSAEERNAFHAQVYAPANDVAQANLQKANAYLQAIQSRYDAMAMGDADTRNALSKEGTEYKRLADAAFAQQQALVRQFGALMAVPITPCGETK
jgi:hypothetical protein